MLAILPLRLLPEAAAKPRDDFNSLTLGSRCALPWGPVDYVCHKKITYIKNVSTNHVSWQVTIT